jgi:hypothetical protein
MIRKGMIILALVVLSQGTAMAQGMLDSVLGPGGLGLWGSGGDQTPQFDVQSQYGAPPPTPQQQYQQPGMPAPGGYPPGYGYGQQPGVYSDWHQYQGQPGAPEGPPPVRYSAPPGQYAPQPGQYPPPTGGQVAAPLPAQGGAPLRPGQYSSRQGGPPQGPPTGDVEELPSGAVRVTTTTPDGTTIQYYPPAGEAPPQQARPQPRRARQGQAPRSGQPARTEQPTGGAPSIGDSGVAMPKPVQIPEGQDPRSGWGAAVNRGPSGR